ncbi:MAG TPA: VOC family protein [Alphaproteobacteria bacterium]|nr:VOC family protein [Alphaproteobacteria bacterium]
MKILGVESVVYGVEDVATGRKYFDDWGLPSVESGTSGADYRLPSGQSIRVRAAGDASLPRAVEGGSTAREIVWGVDEPGMLEKLAADLGRDREVKRDPDGTLHTTDALGWGIAFKTASSPDIGRNGGGRAGNRLNHPLDPPRRARPQRLGHVVFNVPRDKSELAATFYADRLQFRFSDRSRGFGDFLRAPGSNEHHNLFFLHSDRAMFNHVAFEVSGFDEIIFGGKHMEGCGWKADSRPGRHILGSNLFWYFKNPCGGKTEYYADMDVMDDNWKTRVWDKHPGFAMWMMD